MDTQYVESGYMKDMDKIAKAAAHEQWDDVLTICNLALERLKDDWFSHYFLSYKGFAQGELGKLKTGLKSSAKALSIQPSCPLANWRHILLLEELARKSTDLSAADNCIKLCQRMRRRGWQGLVEDQCSKMTQRDAEIRLNDCCFLIAFCKSVQGNPAGAKLWITKYLAGRAAGLSSEFTVPEAREALKAWAKEMRSRRVES